MCIYNLHALIVPSMNRLILTRSLSLVRRYFKKAERYTPSSSDEAVGAGKEVTDGESVRGDSGPWITTRREVSVCRLFISTLFCLFVLPTYLHPLPAALFLHMTRHIDADELLSTNSLWRNKFSKLHRHSGSIELCKSHERTKDESWI